MLSVPSVPVPKSLPSGENVLYEAEQEASEQMLTNSSTRPLPTVSKLSPRGSKNNCVSIRKSCLSVIRLLCF